MSIYCSTFSIDADEHKQGCKRLVRLKRWQKAPRDKDGVARLVIAGDKDYAVDDSLPCTCGSGPIAYQHSGVLPSNDDPRGGCLSLGAIPGHISRTGRPPLSDDMQPYHPWLRISIWGTPKDDPTVLLTWEHVEKLRDELNWWLENSGSHPSQNQVVPEREE